MSLIITPCTRHSDFGGAWIRFQRKLPGLLPKVNVVSGPNSEPGGFGCLPEINEVTMFTMVDIAKILYTVRSLKYFKADSRLFQNWSVQSSDLNLR